MRRTGWSRSLVTGLVLILPACSFDRYHIEIKDPSGDVLYGAIYADFEWDSLFNGGSWADVLRGSDKHSDLKANVVDMRCRTSKRRQLCTFDLVRITSVTDPKAPEAIRCSGEFRYGEDGWAVYRQRRKGESHTRTTIQCAERPQPAADKPASPKE